MDKVTLGDATVELSFFFFQDWLPCSRHCPAQTRVLEADKEMVTTRVNVVTNLLKLLRS